MTTPYYFTLTHSVKPIPRDKAKSVIPVSEWEESTGTIQELVTLIGDDKAIINNFHHKGDTFKVKGKKTKKNLKSSYMLMFDFDAVEMAAEDFFNTMSQTEIPPCIVHTSATNGRRKYEDEVYFNRYHVIYVLDEPITKWWVYERVNRAMADEIEVMTGMSKDKSGTTCEHLFCGNPDAKFFVNEGTISLQFLIDRYSIDLTEPEESERNTSERKNREYISSPVVDDFRNLTLDDFFKKYQYDYVNIMATPLEESPDEKIVLIPENYLYIYRKWHIEEYELKSGVKRISVTDRVGKGKRNRTLYHNLCIRRQITPSLSFENLLHNAVYEMLNHFDNSDGSFTKDEIYSCALNAYNVPVETLNYTSGKKHGYKVSRAYCRAHGTTARKVNAGVMRERQQKRKEERYEAVAGLYNPNLSLRKNVDVMRENGVIISRDSLHRFIGSRLSHSFYNIKKAHTGIAIECDSDPKEKLLNEIKKNPTVTRKQLSEILNVSDVTIKRKLKKLTDDNLIRRIGGRKQGHWEIVEDDTKENETTPEKTMEEKIQELFKLEHQITGDVYDGVDVRILLDEFYEMAVRYGMNDDFLKDVKRRVIESYEYSPHYDDKDYAKYLMYFNKKWNIPYDLPHEEEDGTTHYTGDISLINNTHYVSGNDVMVFLYNKLKKINCYEHKS